MSRKLSSTFWSRNPMTLLRSTSPPQLPPNHPNQRSTSSDIRPRNKKVTQTLLHHPAVNTVPLQVDPPQVTATEPHPQVPTVPLVDQDLTRSSHLLLGSIQCCQSVLISPNGEDLSRWFGGEDQVAIILIHLLSAVILHFSQTGDKSRLLCLGF
uniref:Uncharacterized protein n=1 Tax=Cacopsylla melanoneura TaxID=428564 RepID=A0A8D8T9P2_9HEMI